MSLSSMKINVFFALSWSIRQQWSCENNAEAEGESYAQRIRFTSRLRASDERLENEIKTDEKK